MSQSGPFNYCCGRCFDTYADEHSDMCEYGRNDVGDSVLGFSDSGRTPVPAAFHDVDGPPSLTVASDSDTGGGDVERAPADA